LHKNAADGVIYEMIRFCDRDAAVTQIRVLDTMPPEPLMQYAVIAIRDMLLASPTGTAAMASKVSAYHANPSKQRYNKLHQLLASDAALQTAYVESPANSISERPDAALARIVGSANLPWQQASFKRRIR
jgi:hypothetical protein